MHVHTRNWNYVCRGAQNFVLLSPSFIPSSSVVTSRRRHLYRCFGSLCARSRKFRRTFHWQTAVFNHTVNVAPTDRRNFAVERNFDGIKTREGEKRNKKKKEKKKKGKNSSWNLRSTQSAFQRNFNDSRGELLLNLNLSEGASRSDPSSEHVRFCKRRVSQLIRRNVAPKEVTDRY